MYNTNQSVFLALAESINATTPDARFIYFQHEPGKLNKPPVGEWKRSDGTYGYSLAELRAFKLTAAVKGLALVLGDRFLAFDCDSQEATEEFQRLLDQPRTELVPTLKIESGVTGRCCHIYALDEPLPEVHYKPKSAKLEIRTGAHYQVLSGQHPSGTEYRTNGLAIAPLSESFRYVLEFRSTAQSEQPVEESYTPWTLDEWEFLKLCHPVFRGWEESYDTWLKVGMALHDAFHDTDESEAALQLWIRWSQQAESYAATAKEACSKKWYSTALLPSESQKAYRAGSLCREMVEYDVRHSGSKAQEIYSAPTASEKSLFERDWKSYHKTPVYRPTQLNTFEQEILELAQDAKYPFEGLYLIYLTLIGSVLPKKAKAIRRNTRSVLGIVYLMLIAESGSGKSELVSVFGSVMEELAVERENDYAQKKKSWDKATKAFEKLPAAQQHELYLNAIGQFEGENVDQQSQVEVIYPEPPKESWLFRTKATIEKIRDFSIQWRDRGFTFFGDEFLSLISQGGKMSTSIMTDITEMFNGGVASCDLVSRASEGSDYYRVSYVGGIQRAMLQKLCSTEDPFGFWARFLFIDLGDFQVRSGINSDCNFENFQSSFRAVIQRLLSFEVIGAKDVFKYSSESQIYLEKFEDHCFKLIAERYELNRPFAIWIKRLPAKAMKFAYLMHVSNLLANGFNGFVSDDEKLLIPLETTKRACELAVYQFEVAQSFYGANTQMIPTEKMEIFKRMLKACKGQKTLYFKVASHRLFTDQTLKELYSNDSLTIRTPTKRLKKEEIIKLWQEMDGYGLAHYDPSDVSLTPIDR